MQYYAVIKKDTIYVYIDIKKPSCHIAKKKKGIKEYSWYDFI